MMAVRKLLVYVAVLLVAAVALAAGRVKPLPARWAEKRDPLVQRQREFKHTPIQEALKDLIKLPEVARVRRQSGQPVIVGQIWLGDGYQFASIHYSGEQSQAIFVLTYDVSAGASTRSNLYRSLDYGASFTNIEANLDPSVSDPILWLGYYISDFNKNMLVFPSSNEAKLYYTLDEGDTWTVQPLNPATINPRTLLWNPMEDRWMLAHDTTNLRLYVTQNLGQTWTKIADNVNSSFDYQWGDPSVEDHGDNSVVYYNTFDPADTTRGDNTVHLYSQRHPYDSSTQVEFDPNLGKHDGFLLVGPYIFAQQTDAAGVVSLLVSYKRRPFNKAMIPASDPHVNYFVSHINSLQALVIVEHASSLYNLYLSDITGVYFSLSLPDIVLEPAVGLDLEQIEGVNGTFMANQFVRSSPNDNNPSIRTLISLDNGGNWELVRPPPEDINGRPTHCEPPLCSLHFHMDTSNYTRLGVYSQASAPGIIIAHGNVGEQVSTNPNLYISRYGGNDWEETLADSWSVTMADYGGLIVAAKDYHQDASAEIMYSCDEGFSWQAYTFGGIKLIVYGVITEPGEHTTVVSLFGIRQSQPILWEIVTINFTSIFGRECTDVDYYDWRPWDEYFGEDCILGSSIEISRRSQNQCCLNGRDFVREFDYTVCSCEAEDFECAYGYEREDGVTGDCVLDPDVTIPDPCDGEATSYLDSRYRKIAGDVCVGGDEQSYAGVNQSCPKNAVTIGPSTATGSDTPPTGGSTPPTSGGTSPTGGGASPTGGGTSPTSGGTPAPLSLTLTASSEQLAAGQSVTFNLQQNFASTGDIHYRYDFGDGSDTEDLVGLAQAQMVHHTYQRPGQYAVTLTATSSAWQGVQSIPITVLDPITNVSVSMTQYLDGRVPVGVQVFYRASYDTQFGTAFYGHLSYIWLWGDGSRPTLDYASYTPHVYSDPAVYTLTLTVSNGVSSVTTTTSITTFTSPGGGGKDKHYVALGVGLGVGLIVLIAIAIIIAVCYRRRYSRLQVRYSQLQQDPVQFTYTQGGQIVGDEEDEGAGETQMETLQSDDDEKPLRL